MTEYRSTTKYLSLPDTEENAEALKEWGYSPTMGPTGLIVVYDLRNSMVSAIIPEEDFALQYEEIPSSE